MRQRRRSSASDSGSGPDVDMPHALIAIKDLSRNKLPIRRRTDCHSVQENRDGLAIRPTSNLASYCLTAPNHSLWDIPSMGALRSPQSLAARPRRTAATSILSNLRGVSNGHSGHHPAITACGGRVQAPRRTRRNRPCRRWRRYSPPRHLFRFGEQLWRSLHGPRASGE